MRNGNNYTGIHKTHKRICISAHILYLIIILYRLNLTYIIIFYKLAILQCTLSAIELVKYFDDENAHVYIICIIYSYIAYTVMNSSRQRRRRR